MAKAAELQYTTILPIKLATEGQIRCLYKLTNSYSDIGAHLNYQAMLYHTKVTAP